MKKVYIAGPITKDPDYKRKFKEVAKRLQELKMHPFNPANAPQGMSYRYYINAGLRLLTQCDCICMLPGWSESTGARLEHEYAITVNMPIMAAEETEKGWKISSPYSWNCQEVRDHHGNA